ncbi:MAG: PepSY domain-containing protein [Croceibacterium sp.]
MNVSSAMRQFARWHIWLGWLVGFPILMWTITGLVMVARPIETVRGTALHAKAAAIDPAGLVWPRLTARIQDARLVRQPEGPVWIVTEQGGGRYRYSATDGAAVPPVIETEARLIAGSAYTGIGTIETARYHPADEAPLDLRQNLNAWQVHFSDGTNVYIDDSTGEVLAFRTRWWRVYDVMWGLHIMDLQTREDTSHPILIAFAALAAVGSLIGCILLFRRRKARVTG